MVDGEGGAERICFGWPAAARAPAAPSVARVAATSRVTSVGTAHARCATAGWSAGRSYLPFSTPLSELHVRSALSGGRAARRHHTSCVGSSCFARCVVLQASAHQRQLLCSANCCRAPCTASHFVVDGGGDSSGFCVLVSTSLPHLAGGGAPLPRCCLILGCWRVPGQKVRPWRGGWQSMAGASGCYIDAATAVTARNGADTVAPSLAALLQRN